MLKSVAFRVLAALLIAAVIGVDQATAGLPGEVAHSSMGGSTLMRTTAQFGAWTHWIVDYDNFVELNVTDDYYWDKFFYQTPGQASLHWKYNDNNHLLFRVRGMDLGGQNSNFLWGGTLGNPFLSPAGLIDELGISGYNAYREGQMLNLAWARPMAAGGAFSVGVLFADTGYKESTDPEYVDESSAFGAQVTWGNGNGFDLAASFHSEGSTEGAGETEIESDFTHFDLTARIERGNGWIYQLGALMGSGSVVEDDVSLMGLMGNVGRHLLDTADGGVTAEFFVNHYSLKYEPSEGGEFKEGYMTVPGTRVAAWHQISQRFQVMAGANAFWTTGKMEETFEEDTFEEKMRGMTFSYSGGLAFTPTQNFRIEGELQMGALNQLLSLGNQSPLLTRVGGTFVF